MQNETKILKFARIYFKIFNVIWFGLLAVFAVLACITDSIIPVLPMLVLLAVGGGAIFKMWMHSIVEVVISGEVAELERFDKKKGSVKFSLVKHIKSTQ